MRANTSLGVSQITVGALLCVGTVGVAHAQVSPSQALLNNTFVGSIGGIYSLLNYLWPIWDDKNQALHDKLAKTNVVRIR